MFCRYEKFHDGVMIELHEIGARGRPRRTREVKERSSTVSMHRLGMPQELSIRNGSPSCQW